MNAIALLRPTWMPTAVAASWSIATACIAAPRLVRCRNSDQQRRSRPRRSRARPAGRTCGCARRRRRAARSGPATARPGRSAPQMRMASASSTMPKPIVPISIRSKSLFSSGRSTRSMTRPISAGDHDRDHHGQRERQLGRQVEGRREVGADHHDVAVREVDQAHRAVDEGEPQRDQRVDGAEAEPADERLEEDLHALLSCPSIAGSPRAARLQCVSWLATSLPLVMMPIEVAKMPTPVSSKAKLPSRPVVLRGPDRVGQRLAGGHVAVLQRGQQDLRAVVGLRAVQFGVLAVRGLVRGGELLRARR